MAHFYLRKWILAATALAFAATLSAQKYSNEFLSIGVGARAQALGNAVVAGLNDVYAGVWNPAGLAALTREDGLQIGAMHAEWFGGVADFDYLGVTLPSQNRGHRLAFSMIRFAIDEIPNTLSLYESDGSINFDNLVEFSAADYAFIGSYARTLRPADKPIGIGGNVKVVHRRIGPFATSWGFGIDLGAQWQRNNWSFGALARDITTTFNAWSFNFTDEERETLALTGNEIPINSVEITKPQLLLGAARRFPLGKLNMRAELDLQITTDGRRNTLISGNPFSIDPSLGVEAGLRDFLFFRGGVNQFQRIADFGGEESLSFRPSLGVGMRLGALHVDYAYTDLGGDQNTYSHVISLRLGLKPRTASVTQ